MTDSVFAELGPNDYKQTFFNALSSISSASSTASMQAYSSINDRSVVYLGMLFGRVGSVLNGNRTIVAAMFNIFNLGIFTIVSFIAAYTAILGVIGTASEGQFMSKKMQGAQWIMFRTFGGASALVPMFNGYSFIQVFMMWVVMQSVVLANLIWSTAYQSIQQSGGVVPMIAAAFNLLPEKTNSARNVDNQSLKEVQKTQAILSNLSNFISSYVQLKVYQREMEDKEVARRVVITITKVPTNSVLITAPILLDSAQDNCDETTSIAGCLITSEKEYTTLSYSFTTSSEAQQQQLFISLKDLDSKIGNIATDVYRTWMYAEAGLNSSCGLLPEKITNVSMVDSVGCQNGALLHSYIKELVNNMVQSFSIEETTGGYGSNVVGSKITGYASGGWINAVNSYNMAMGKVYKLRTSIKHIFNVYTLPAPMASPFPPDYLSAELSTFVKDRLIKYVLGSTVRDGLLLKMIGTSSYSPYNVNTVSSSKVAAADTLIQSSINSAQYALYPDSNSLKNPPLTPNGQAARGVGNNMCWIPLISTGYGCENSSSDVGAMIGKWIEGLFTIPFSVFTDFVNIVDHPNKMFSPYFEQDIQSFVYWNTHAWVDTFVNNRMDLIYNPIEAVSGFGFKLQIYSFSFFYNASADIIMHSINLAMVYMNRTIQLKMTQGIAKAIAEYAKQMLWRFFTMQVQDQGLDPILIILLIIVPLNPFSSIFYPIVLATAMIVATTAEAFLLAGQIFNEWNYMLMNFLALRYVPLMLGIATPLLGLGSVISIYIPMIPLLTFMVAVLGWFMHVIEAMVAAPLVIIGVTQPKGHDLLGAVEQTMMLTLGIFIRPAAIVIGFIFAVIITAIAMLGLTVIMLPMMALLLQSQANNTGFIGGIVTVLLLYIHINATYRIFDYAYGIIYRLPSQIMKWIGRPESDSMEEEAIKAGKEGVRKIVVNTLTGGVKGMSGMSVSTAGKISQTGGQSAGKGF